MIDEKKLIELLENWKSRLGDSIQEYPVKFTLKMVIDKINALPVVDVTDTNVGSKWIPVSERLPECEWGYETEAVLFQLESGTIEVGFYGTGGKYRDSYFRPYRDSMDGFDAKNVVAWMPLPELYKGE